MKFGNDLIEQNKIVNNTNNSSVFVDRLFKKDTITENGAISNSTTGSFLVDDFGKNGTYFGRGIEDIFIDMDKLWSENPDLALKSIFYIRAISRKENIKGVKVSGQGNRDESLKRFLWLAYNQSETFYRVIPSIPLVGYWKDIWNLLLIDYENRIDRNKIYSLLQAGLNVKEQRDLVLKYLPSIKAGSKLKNKRLQLLNKFANEFRNFLGLTKKEYRLLKTSGKAHKWQQLVTQGLYQKIKFDTIGGKALLQLVKGNWFDRHNLTKKYIEWLETKGNVNFNGYPFELVKVIKRKGNNSIISKTVDLQYNSLLKNSSEFKENVLVAIDTSGSMNWQSVFDDITAYDIAIGLGIYFSDLNKGAFKNLVAMFDDTTTFKKLSGSFSTKVKDIMNSNIAWGSTNFESIITALIKFRKENPDVPLSEYPKTILVVSDMQFNPVGYNVESNYENAKRRLAEVGITDVKFVWWQVTDRTKDFPSTLDDVGTYILSGYDGNVIRLLLGEELKENIKQPKNMYELMLQAYNQFDVYVN